MSTARAAEVVLAVASEGTGAVLSQTLIDTVKLRARRGGGPGTTEKLRDKIASQPVPGEGFEFQFGRFRLLHQIAVGSLGPVFCGVDTETGQSVTIKHLTGPLQPEESERIPDWVPERIADELQQLVRLVPHHPNLAPVMATGVADGAPYIVSAFQAGESLDGALETYGPAAIVDALPRLEHLADALDLAAANGVWHGALHPADIIVSAEDTCLIGLGIVQTLERAGVPINPRPPYTSPEATRGEQTSPAGDQFALAAIAHEWMLGRHVERAADSRLVIPALPDVDANLLSAALTRALAPQPTERFPSCSAFVAALAASAQSPPRSVVEPAPPPVLTLTDLPADLPLSPDVPALSSASPSQSTGGFGLGIAVAVLLAAIVIGAIGVYALRINPLTRSTAEQNQAAAPTPPAKRDPAAFTEAPVSGSMPPGESAAAATRTPSSRGAERGVTTAGSRSDAELAARVRTGRLLVRSTPAGATVTVDGVARGVTPVPLRDLELGTRSVVISRPGYLPAERQVTLTSDRPSRSIEVVLSASSALPRGISSTARGATATTATLGSLLVESRPSNAVVMIDGQKAGTTPLTMDSLTPGIHSVRIERAGYRSVATSVEVKAGERARVAASLVGGQHEE